MEPERIVEELTDPVPSADLPRPVPRARDTVLDIPVVLTRESDLVV